MAVCARCRTRHIDFSSMLLGMYPKLSLSISSLLLLRADVVHLSRFSLALLLAIGILQFVGSCDSLAGPTFPMSAFLPRIRRHYGEIYVYKPTILDTYNNCKQGCLQDCWILRRGAYGER